MQIGRFIPHQTNSLAHVICARLFCCSLLSFPIPLFCRFNPAIHFSGNLFAVNGIYIYVEIFSTVGDITLYTKQWKKEERQIMKRKIIARLLLLSTCVLCACGSGENPENGQTGAAGTEQEPAIKVEQEPNMETQQEKNVETKQDLAVTVADHGEYRNDTWDGEDFLFFGLEGIEKFNQEEPVSYSYYKTEERRSLSVTWKGTNDFDVITQYTELLFDMAANAGDGNYSKVYNNDAMNYVTDKSYATFADACSDQESWNKAENYFIMWHYRYEDKEIQIAVSGEYNEKNNYMSLELYGR